MRCNNSMNNSSLTCKGRAQKASKVRKKWSNFQTKNVRLPLYLRNVAPSRPIKWAQMAQHTKCARKEKGGKREKKEEKMKD